MNSHTRSNKKKHLFPLEKKLKRQLKLILGFKPKHYRIYQLALIHKSASTRFSKKQNIHNERLEYLGDAILDSIVAEYLYLKFTDRDEGFLTQMRSKIVNRETLRGIAIKMGIGNLIVANLSKDSHVGLYGDALEAIIGAVYLDRGYKRARKFIIEKILDLQINLDVLSETEMDFKSRIIEWGQKNKKDINFTSHEQLNENNKNPVFVAHLLVFDEIVGMGMGKSKKEAEQNAARQATQIMSI